MWPLIVAQALVNQPVTARAAEVSAAPDPERLSLVVAQSVSETDPQPLCDRPDCTSLFLGRYADATVLAGLPLPAAFAARVEMGSPWNMSYRLVLIVEQREGREPLVRAMTGFNRRTGEACFETPIAALSGWRPQGPGIFERYGAICVRGGSGSDPHAQRIVGR